jgi:diguanylate cyclase (GGDEF)-like protein
LKSEKRTKHVPVIFITARSENEDEMKGLEVGAVDYIRKPFNQAVVKARVKAHLELKMHRDKLELDGLTGIPNRRRFDEYIETEWRMASRENSNISLIMIDIDYFKNFNDGYGHLSGDECLKKVAATLAKSVNRPMDFVARYGGEEFACILPGTDLNGAIYIAETMKKNIERLTITHDYSLIGNYLTISLGVATIVPSMHFSYNVLIEGADEALFMAKKSGRNRIHHLNLNDSPE